jgi:SAM-dependent methyltransferase
LDHADHVALLADAVGPGGFWADIGAGTGAFTLALAELLGAGGRIVAIDRDTRALAVAAEAVAARFPGVILETLVTDFTKGLLLSPLDGLVAANSLHFVPRERQVGVVRALAAHLRPGGRFVTVEYDADVGNTWVPHPFAATSWTELAKGAGLVDARLMRRVPSSFLGAIYSAVATRP